jgi:DNA-binding NarL/FixJ family response regulator
MQMEVFEKDIINHFDSIAAAGVNLSKNMTIFLESYLQLHELSFADLTDNSERITELQSRMLEPLLQQMKQEDCSGVFVMLDTTINSTLPDADTSRAGIYLKINGYKSTYNPVTLLRGDAEIARANNIMPHRKWKLEFDTEIFPSYESILADAHSPAVKSYQFTEVSALPGTEEKVMLLTVPMAGDDGTYYGVCGFEISESYFMSYYAQPTKVDYLTYLLTPFHPGTIDTADGFSCGASDGYYRAPQGQLTISNAGNNLLFFEGDEIPYLGVSRKITLSPNTPEYMLSVMMRKSDFDKDMRTEDIKNVSLLILLLLAAVSCCYYFSRRFLTPILRSLEQLKSDTLEEMDYDIPEITDLFEFLSQKDREHEKTLITLKQEKQDVQTAKDSLLQEYEKVQSEHCKTQTEFEKAQIELERLAYSRQTEIDPDAYAHFLEGIETLTTTEQKIFSHYLDGLTVKEIAKLLSVKESTVYSHNKNIYSKLGINSLKQLLRYAALMRQQEKEAAGQA